MKLSNKKSERSGDKKKTSPGNKWLILLFSILVPFLLFFLVEIGLRVIGYGFPTSATVKCKLKSQAAYCDNNKFSWRFFPRKIAREPDPYIFLKKKINTYRIFILGGSAAQGVPDPSYNFGRILKVMLKKTYPGVNFQIINTAMTAINSHVVLEIAKDIAKFQSDLFIVYMGNNEVVGPFGAGTIFSPFSPNLSLLRMGIALKTTKIGQLVSEIITSIKSKGNSEKSWRGLEMFLNNQVSADDPHLKKVYKYFQKNIEDICSIAHEKDIKVLLSTVGSNLKDCPPFASKHRGNITQEELTLWRRYYQNAIDLINAAKHKEGIEFLKKAGSIDDNYAELHFRKAKSHWKLGEYQQAKKSYIKARELDTLRFRADQKINNIIQKVAENKINQGVILANTIEEFHNNSPHKISGKEFFYEHVHLNYKGNYLLAKIIFNKIKEILPKWIVKAESGDGSIISKNECAKYLAYTDWDRFNLTYNVLYNYIKKAPYNNQLFHKKRVKDMEDNLDKLSIFLAPESLKISAAIYKEAIKTAPSDWWLHNKYAELLHKDLKKYKEAANQYQIVTELIPHAYHGYAGLGIVLLRQGKFSEAVKMNRKALKINPFKADIYNNLGFSLQKNGDLKKAEKIYRKAIQLQPRYIQAYKNLGKLLNETGRINEGIAVFQNGIKVNKNSWRLHHTLGFLFNKQNNIDAAIKELRKALKIYPNSKISRELLNNILLKKTGF